MHKMAAIKEMVQLRSTRTQITTRGRVTSSTWTMDFHFEVIAGCIPLWEANSRIANFGMSPGIWSTQYSSII